MSRFVLAFKCRASKSHCSHLPGVFIFHFSYVNGRGYPFMLCFYCIHHFCLMTTPDSCLPLLGWTRTRDGWLLVSVVRYFICCCLLCHISHLLCLSYLSDSPFREYPLQLMHDFLYLRHSTAFRGEHGCGLVSTSVSFYCLPFSTVYAISPCTHLVGISRPGFILLVHPSEHVYV